MDELQLKYIRDWLVSNIFRNANAIYNDNARFCPTDGYDSLIDMVDIIATLYNLLHKEVTGEAYDYMFHWANKVGGEVRENIFESIKNGGFYLTNE